VRLDSGDLAELSRLARRTLDAAGLQQARVVASNDLDEKRISALKAAGAPIDVWGVGTRLVTGHDQPALGGVYKLAALRGEGGAWHYRVKRSEDPVKVSLPGRHGVQRRRDAAGKLVGDLIYDVDLGLSGQHHDLIGQLGEGLGEEVMVEAMRGGRRLLADDLAGARARCAAALSALPEGPASGAAPYPVALDQGLHQLQQQLLAAGGR
jgi:nicotinate phosphoribosyltransferase